VFENIPDRLTESVKGLGEIINVNTDIRYIAAAGAVSAEYISKNFFGPNPDKFLNAQWTNADGNQGYEYSTRILLIGETLFVLRSCPGFSEFCARLKERELRATFYELYGAKYFFRWGFEIHGRPLTYVKGQDFDFSAVRGEEEINVEVTAPTVKEFSAKTLANALHHKRTQVPKTKPATIVCVLPESWATKENWNIHAPNIVRKFLTGTRRVNAVILLMEHHLGEFKTGGGAFVVHQNTILNRNTYFQLRDSSFLFTGVQISSKIRSILDNSEDVGKLSGKLDELRTIYSNKNYEFKWAKLHTCIGHDALRL
jgi:hypothetical protein